jgi:hypothetical protein
MVTNRLKVGVEPVLYVLYFTLPLMLNIGTVSYSYRKTSLFDWYWPEVAEENHWKYQPVEDVVLDRPETVGEEVIESTRGWNLKFPWSRI